MIDGAEGNRVERKLEQIERIPVFGPYLSFMAAAHLTLTDALGLTALRTAIYGAHRPTGTDSIESPASPMTGTHTEDAKQELRQAA